MSLFTSTAEFYGAFRSDVPDAVAEILSEAAPAGSPRRLLDVGTGTGFAIRALLPFFDEALGVDTDEALLAVAARDLEPSMSRVRLIRGAAESFAVPDGWQAQLITVCRAFHWFDRPRFLANVIPSLSPDRPLAIFGDRSVWAANSPWKIATIEVVRQFLGQDRRAGDGLYQRPDRDYADDLREAGFRDIQQRVVPIERSRSIDSVIGYLHSTSFASLAVLGDTAEEFDDRVRERLAPLVDPHGLLTDHNEFGIFTAKL